MLRAPRRPMMALLLIAVFARVFTGAAEAQVSFTSLVTDSGVNKRLALHQTEQSWNPAFSSAERANPVPDKQKNTVTYKKYLTPENSTAVVQSNDKKIAENQNLTAYQNSVFLASPIWILRANAPPKSSFALTHSVIQHNYSIISWENQFGTSTIYNGTGGIGRL